MLMILLGRFDTLHFWHKIMVVICGLNDQSADTVIPVSPALCTIYERICQIIGMILDDYFLNIVCFAGIYCSLSALCLTGINCGLSILNWLSTFYCLSILYRLGSLYWLSLYRLSNYHWLSNYSGPGTHGAIY